MNYKHLHYFWKTARAGGVVRAGEELHVTPQTVSGQIQLLEADLGVSLFRRSGRNLELTDAGRLALGYADDIFSLGVELEEMVRLYPGGGRPVDFRVGVADALPKPIAYQLLAPALELAEPVRMTCREWKLDSLLSELAAHRLDLVLSDMPIPPSANVRAFSHRLGESGISFFASPALVSEDSVFPECLNGTPMLLPGEDAAVRNRLLRWLERYKLRPRVLGEFDDSALVEAFGQAGKGAFIAPSVLERDIESRYGVRALGRTAEIREEFFALSVERRLTHPCVVAITQAARGRLFAA